MKTWWWPELAETCSYYHPLINNIIINICCVIDKIPVPIYLYTPRGWHISELYKNIRSKLLKCSASIYFNKQCLVKKVIPKNANLNFKNNSPASQVTARKAQMVHIKYEIKFLFKRSNIFYMRKLAKGITHTPIRL